MSGPGNIHPNRFFFGAPFIGGPFLGGLLGGVLGSALIRPRPYTYYPPYYPPYPPYYGYGVGNKPYYW
ncbi:hypothetical protein [Fervidibacillus halotolerans]|uniref:Uncharacterized protein n=1 Tax=Fervidibacillus halotolerans TaxID=2980027 RepID=A0A9E8LY40_9BACI|nr:hypothetical protein [Fervidibacillus halotolerans]WAA11832.1 hypothetical protein OE105_09560 [Fervidibacillus halotolerans]